MLIPFPSISFANCVFGITFSAKIFKLKGYGMPRLNTQQKGDHYLKIILDIPAKLSKREKQLYAELAKEAKLDLKSGGKSGFFDQFK